MTEQLVLPINRPEWYVDGYSREIGRCGLQAARDALARMGQPLDAGTFTAAA